MDAGVTAGTVSVPATWATASASASRDAVATAPRKKLTRPVLSRMP